MTTPTRNPIPSGLPQDFRFNIEKVDEFVNSLINQYIDRFGVSRLTIAGINSLARTVIDKIESDGADAVSVIGWQELGDWAVSLIINNRDQVVWYDNAWYKYIGTLPHTISGDSPETDGGIWSDSNPTGKWVNIGDAALRSELGSINGGSIVRLTDGDTVQEKFNKTELGTDSLRDSVTPGNLDVLLNSTTIGVVDLRETKHVIPNGDFTATRWFRNRGVSASDPGVTSFDLRGQGHSSTILKHPSGTGEGDHIYVDYLKNAYIGRMTLDNSALGSGTSQSTSKNGQMWIRHSQDSHFDDIVFKGGDVLSYCLDDCKNILSTNLKVDYQFRYPTGYSKSPLIVGDFSEKCMFIGGYVRAISPDGSVIYKGDLADNDQANDTKWAFINLLGLPYATTANANACMWQEGEDAPSNSHFIGMNYYGNGISHGISQLSVGTDIGCTYRESQVRAVWNSSRFITIGGQFYDNLGLNTGGASNPNVLGGIHSDNARFTATVGSYFSGNLRDIQDYTGGIAHAFNSIHSTSDRFSAPIALSGGGNAKHLGIVNSQLTDTASIFATNPRAHTSVVATHVVGSFGTFGSGAAVTVTDVMASTFIADGYSGPLLTQNGLGVINFTRCEIEGYVSIISATAPGNVTFDKCTFKNVTFTSTDLTARYIGCNFINCTNAPSTLGLNFSADSFLRPSSARCEVVLSAGGSYTFPSWIHDGRGVFDISVGGRGSDLPLWKGYISKSSAGNTGSPVTIIESNPGSINISWPVNGYITITVSTTGNYSIKLG